MAYGESNGHMTDAMTWRHTKRSRSWRSTFRAQ